jgi:alpha-ribazole phosphatase
LAEDSNKSSVWAQESPGSASAAHGAETAKQGKEEVLHPEEAITSFLLVRHGHTRATERGLLYTDPDAELTDKGIEQARAIARYISRLSPQLLLCSKAKRVIDTANVIAPALSMEPQIYDGLSEWHVGDWEGRSYLDIKHNDPEIYKAWSADPIRNRPPNGESIEDVCDRVDGHVRSLIDRHSGSTVALVTHAGIIRSILIRALGMPVDNFWRISIPVGSISRVDFSKSFATVHFMSLRPEQV